MTINVQPNYEESMALHKSELSAKLIDSGVVGIVLAFAHYDHLKQAETAIARPGYVDRVDAGLGFELTVKATALGDEQVSRRAHLMLEDENIDLTGKYPINWYKDDIFSPRHYSVEVPLKNSQNHPDLFMPSSLTVPIFSRKFAEVVETEAGLRSYFVFGDYKTLFN